MKFWNDDTGTIDFPMAEDENGIIYYVDVEKENPMKILFKKSHYTS